MQDSYLSYYRERAGGTTPLLTRLSVRKAATMRQHTIAENRERKEIFSEMRVLPPEVLVQEISCAGVPCEWISSAESVASPRVILYMHGGSWLYGNLDSARPFAALLEEYTGCRVLVVDYRLAPEHPYPAGLDDCLSVYQWLLAHGYLPHNIAFFGDSAGGNLCLCLLNRLKALGYDYPACAGAASPVTDMRPDSVFCTSGDDLLTARVVPEQETSIFDLYAPGQERGHPFLSPICGDLAGLPPILLHCGGLEPIAEDNIAYGATAYAQGVDIRVVVYEHLFHDFTVVGRALKESRHSLADFAAFFAEHCPSWRACSAVSDI